MITFPTRYTVESFQNSTHGFRH